MTTPLHSLAASLFLASTLAACASGEPSGAPAPASTTCSAEECAHVVEPPIAPSACGAGKEKEIGTTCERAPSGVCTKVLTCGGKRPE